MLTLYKKEPIGIIWVIIQAAINLFVNMKRYSLISSITFGLMAVIFILDGLLWLYNPPKTNLTIVTSSGTIPIVISKEEILKSILIYWEKEFILFLTLGIIASVVLYPPEIILKRFSVQKRKEKR